ncbi:hypothetical protein TIFTF001_031521 [Ficus carica]|uniref:Uncharacterized protein n=1 Tax=Ficus carica TaxID=3494 RepID=A0AA88DVF0_FICCA|nr:hypothetical protein TIFTF001_031521 [Ficus carica]
MKAETKIGSRFCKVPVIFFDCFEIEIGLSEIIEALIGDITRRPQDCENRNESREKSRTIPPTTSQIERIFDEELAFRAIFSCGGEVAMAIGASWVS